MPTYHDPTEKMLRAFEEERARDCHRERLEGVTIAVKAVHASRNKDDEPRGEALARDGDPILGKVRIMSLEDRSDGSSDVRILLNGDRWGSITWGMQCSVIDICLMRIEVQMQDGKPKLDDLGRPMLRKRKWGYQLCGFPEVDERHGKSSIGVHNMRTFFGEHGQYYMPFLHEEPPDDFLSVPARTTRTAKPVSDGGEVYVRGSLATKRVRERMQHLCASTILGVLQLELEHAKPRTGVVSAAKDRLIELKKLPDFIAVEKGHDPTTKPDLAAAVLVTTRARPTLALLDRMVPDCEDPRVLADVLEDEGDDDPREAVLEVVNMRIRELSP